MFELAFILTLAGFVIASVLAVYSLHTDNSAHYARARGGFYASSVLFMLTGVVRFYGDAPAGLLQGTFTIWGFFYIFVALLIFTLIYLNFSRWSAQWKTFAAFALPFISVILAASIPFTGSSRKIILDLSHGLVPVHILVSVLGELFYLMGFAGSVLYLVMEGQLRKKRSMKFIYRFPTLESIENFNRWAISRAFLLLSAGIASGMFMTYTVFGAPFQGTAKEVILYLSWMCILALFTLSRGNAVGPHRRSQLAALAFLVLLGFVLFSNIFIQQGFHSFR